VSIESFGAGYLLRGAHVGYAFALHPEAALDEPVLRHLHWGAPITVADAAALADRDPDRARPSGAWSRPRAHEEELVTLGGLRRDEPVLDVEFADRVRGLALRLVSHGIHGSVDTELRVVLADTHYPLEIELGYRVLADVDAIVRTTTVRNTGAEPVYLHRAMSAGWAPPPGAGYTLTTLSGAVLAETQLTGRPLEVGRVVIETRAGSTGHEHQPWFALDRDGTEVWSAALEWSGSHRTVVQTAQDGGTHVVHGANELGHRQRLDPGESVDLPRSVGIYAPDGHQGSSLRWQRYERRYVLAQAARERPVLYNSWEATHYDVRLDHQLRLARRAAGLGVELFVVDDGWFRGDPSTGIDHLGDWDPAPVRFPAGLRVLADAVHDLGMRFGVWAEPEMANVDSDVHRAHPEWFYRWPTREPTLVPRLRHQLVLDYTRADVREHVVAALDRLISAADVDFLKWDMNRPITELYSAEPDHPVALAHTRGLYEVLDRLRDRHPDLLLETCSAGGGRLDHGMFRRAHWAWASDNTDAVDRLSIQEGFGHLHAAAAMMCWVTDAPGTLSPRSVPLRFRFHVAMCGALGLGGDLLAMSEEDAAEARELIALYREVRPTVHQGDRYHLGTATEPLFGVQYVHGDDVLVFAFAPQVRHLLQRRELRLAGLDPAADYEDVDTGARYSGSLLLHRGLYLELAGDYVSSLTRLCRV